jgi:hypothetical protein
MFVLVVERAIVLFIEDTLRQVGVQIAVAQVVSRKRERVDLGAFNTYN